MSEMTIAQGLASQAVAWLLTYALHSTLFLGLAWLVSRRLAQRMPAVEETVWRFALVAGLITASLQLSVGREPLTGSWRLAAAPGSAVSASELPASTLGAPASSRPRAARMAAVPATRAEAPASAAPSRSLPVSLPLGLAGIWLAGALLLAFSWVAGALRLRRRLRPRPQVVESTMVTLLGELKERAGLQQPVRLTCSSRLPVPVALGLRRPEICVPPRALAGLAPEQQEGMLAHELAHLVRRDPFWLVFGRLLASVLFFQPLNWVAVRRLRELSELLCDEWAVGRTGRPVSLARCLTEVAGWSFPRSRPLSLPVPGMADRPSNLARRIRRLLEDARSPQRRVHPAWLAAGMLVLVIAVAAAAPGVQAAVAGAETPVLASDPSAAEAPDREEAPEPPESEADEDFEDLENLEDLADLGELEHLGELEALEELGELEALGDLEAFELDVDAMVPEDLADDLADDLEDELERSLAGVTEEPWKLAMDLYSAGLGAAYAGEELSEAEAEELERRAEELSDRISRQVDEQLEPKLEELEKVVEKHMSGFENSEEMRRLMRQADELAQRARPSEEEMERLRVQVEKLRADGGMSAEDKEKIREEARRLAQQHRLSDKDRAEADELRRQARELARRSMREHQPEIERMRREILEETRVLREEIRRQLDNDPQLRELRERREKERDQRREEMRKDRERAPRAPRPPRPERHVHLHINPDVQVRVEPARAPKAPPHVGVRVRPAVAPTPPPTPTARPALAPMVAPAPPPTPRPAPALAPVAEPTPAPTPTPAVAPEPPAR